MENLVPVRRMSLSAAVFDQIAARILDGTWAAGAVLPPERGLTASFGVNRQALREALQRLDQLGLVEIRHGGATRILDYRRSAGLDLLPRLFIRTDGTIDPRVVGAVMEMRAAIGADAAALCATRADERHTRALRDLLSRLQAADPAQRASLDAEFWDLIVDGSGNICYRLSLNALRATCRPAEPMVLSILAPQRRALSTYRDVVDAVMARDAERARAAAASMLADGTEAVKAFFADTEEEL